MEKEIISKVDYRTIIFIGIIGVISFSLRMYFFLLKFH